MICYHNGVLEIRLQKMLLLYVHGLNVVEKCNNRNGTIDSLGAKSKLGIVIVCIVEYLKRCAQWSGL